MNTKEFLGMVIQEANRNGLKFVYTPKELGEGKVIGLFILEKTRTEKDVKAFTQIEKL